jgi:hypothetical protein
LTTVRDLEQPDRLALTDRDPFLGVGVLERLAGALGDLALDLRGYLFGLLLAPVDE